MNETGYFAHSLFAVSFSTCCAFGAGDNGCEIMGLALVPRSVLSPRSGLRLRYTLSPSVKSCCFTFSFSFMQNYPVFKQTRLHLRFIWGILVQWSSFRLGSAAMKKLRKHSGFLLTLLMQQQVKRGGQTIIGGQAI